VSPHIASVEMAFQHAVGTNAQGSIFSEVGRDQTITINQTFHTVTNDTGANQLLMNTAPALVQPNILYKSMPLSSRIFTGRKDYLDRLEQHFRQEDDQPPRRKKFLLYGLGGTGKSQISIKFVEQSADW
jgi:transcriptional regulator with AAA-type ATPase domain